MVQTKNSRSLKFLFVLLFALVALWSQPTSYSSALPPAKKTTLRVMTFNIHVGVGMDKKLDLQRIADVITRERPDLVGLQEVDRGVKRTEGVDQIRELARMTRMDYAFGHNLDFQGGQYGIAILSRLLIQKVDHQKFANRREAERRGMLRVEVEVDRRRLNFANTHLDYQTADGRLFEAEQLLKVLDGISEPLIVVGDFNDEPVGSTYKLMLSRFDDAWMRSRTKEAGLSYPADEPVKRIDYIFFSRSHRIRTRRVWTVNTLASDHLPVMAELEISY